VENLAPLGFDPWTFQPVTIHYTDSAILAPGIVVLFIYITRLASNEMFSPSSKIHWELGRAKDLSAPRYIRSCTFLTLFSFLGGSILVQNGLALRCHFGNRNLCRDYQHTETQVRF
jgi:hypothetical protein